MEKTSKILSALLIAMVLVITLPFDSCSKNKNSSYIAPVTVTTIKSTNLSSNATAESEVNGARSLGPQEITWLVNPPYIPGHAAGQKKGFFRPGGVTDSTYFMSPMIFPL